MENPLLTFRQNSIISEKPGYLTEKLKTFTSLKFFVIFFFSHITCLTMSEKGYLPFFNFVWILSYW